MIENGAIRMETMGRAVRAVRGSLEPRLGEASACGAGGSVVLEFETDELALLILAEAGGGPADFLAGMLSDRDRVERERAAGFVEYELGLDPGMDEGRGLAMFRRLSGLIVDCGGDLSELRVRFDNYVDSRLAEIPVTVRLEFLWTDWRLVTRCSRDYGPEEWKTVREDPLPETVEDLERLGLV
jgi:hypothetical protein